MEDNNICAVILCAGKGSRLAPVTNEIPKSLIEVKSIPLIEYKLESLVGLVNRVIIVIGYLGDKIKEKYGNKFKDLNLIYVKQKELLGTGHAILSTKNYLTKDSINNNYQNNSKFSKFIVLNGDDIYSKEDIENLLQYDLAILSLEVQNPQKFGVLTIDENNHLIEINEKPQNPKSNLINIGCYVLDTSIFDYELKLSLRGEYEIVDYLNYLISIKKQIKVIKVKNYWIPVNNFEELEYANNYDFQENN